MKLRRVVLYLRTGGANPLLGYPADLLAGLMQDWLAGRDAEMTFEGDNGITTVHWLRDIERIDITR